jgi:hypothetical protein
MIDIFTVVVPHVLMGIAVWRLIHCDDLDHDPLLPGATSAFNRARRAFRPAPDKNCTPGA